MRGWAELAPYNFMHAMRLEEPANLERWLQAAEDALRPLELGAAPVTIESPATTIDEHLDAELNRGFGPGELPLRFFVINETNGGHWLGVVIDHWLADDYSCRLLLERVYANYRSPGRQKETSELVRATAPTARRGWLGAWFDFFQQATMFRRAIRISLRDPVDPTVRTFRTALPEGMLESIRALAKRQGATVHDVFLASVAQVFGRDQAMTSKRDSVAIASAMDLRRFEPEERRNGFGLLITQYPVIEHAPDKVAFEQLISRIARRTSRLRKVANLEVFGPALTLWRLARSRRARATLYQRGAPFVAGLSNVNLTGSWIEQAPISEYRRVGPTGVVIPILLMISTLHGRIFIDTTYRTAAFSRPAAEILLEEFAQHLSMTR